MGSRGLTPCLRLFACKKWGKSTIIFVASGSGKKIGGLMAAFAIMRSEKIKSAGSLRRAVQHNTRERMPLNADQKRTGRNVHQGGTAEDVMRNYQALLPDKVRKNAVYAVEFVMTASPEFSGDWDSYLKNCDKWVEKMFGKENILSVAHHKDETTPHSHVLVIPLKDKKLNAKFYIGGSRDRMTEIQNDFFEKVGLPAGMDRGKSRAETKARHTPHTLAAAAQKNIDVQEKIKSLLGMYPKHILEMKNQLKAWNDQSPAGLEAIAKNLRSRGVASTTQLMELQERHQKQLSRKM